MEIVINNENVTIRLSGDTQYSMTYAALTDVEKAIEIIRNIQESALIDFLTIRVT